MDAKFVAWPILTVSLIAANVGVFACVEDPWAYGFASDESGNWLWTSWISLFLHADTDHLLGNMAFLWAFGSALEGRIARPRLLGLYLAAGLAAHVVNLLGVIGLEDPSVRAIGASGAISGLMGIFLVRCRTYRISLAATPLGLPLPFAPRVQVNASFLVGLFFAVDLASARDIAEGAPLTIGHWAHVGGCLFGIAAGYACGLYRAAAREAIERQALATDENGDFGRAACARDSLLKSAPDHIDARLERARAQHRFSCSPQGASDYEHAIRLLIAKDRERAADVFIEYWRKYMRPLKLRAQLRLTSALIARGQLDTAARCLELAAQDPGADADLCAMAHARETEILTAMGIARSLPETCL
jgi:membrane associated rhomboid family serine protease